MIRIGSASSEPQVLGRDELEVLERTECEVESVPHVYAWKWSRYSCFHGENAVEKRCRVQQHGLDSKCFGYGD